MQAANVKWIEGLEFSAKMPSGHEVRFDADRQHNAATSPMEMLLGALGACTATDVVSILKKKRQNLESLEVEVSGERAPNPPQVWTKINVIFRLRGSLDEKAVTDAIELSEKKYCSVSAMLQNTAEITFRHEILSPV